MTDQIKYKFDKISLIKILKGAGIALGGAALVYLSEVVPQIDFGVWTPIAVAVAAILINSCKEWIAGK